MEISEADNLEKIWSNEFHPNSFSILRRLEISRCERLVSIFPSKRWDRFEKLDYLCISSCGSLEEIFDFQRINVKEGQFAVNDIPRFQFPNLTTLHLVNLSKLRSFYSKMHITEWPMLRVLSVYNCKGVHVFA